MVFFSEDNDLVTFVVKLSNALLHLRDDRASGIDHSKPKVADLFKGRRRFAVRTNENFRFDAKFAVLFGNALEIGMGDGLQALRTKTIYFHRIVNNIAKRI